MKETSENVNDLRKQLEEVDKEIVNLLDKRAILAINIGKNKRENLHTQTSNEKIKDSLNYIYKPGREAQVLKAIIAENPGTLKNENIEAIFRQIISFCRALQQPLSVSYLGPEGTFTHTAALKFFGQGASLLPTKDIRAIFDNVEGEKADCGIVPIENSSEGMVNYTLDSFIRSNVKICSEIELRIRHHLFISNDTSIDNFHCIYAHEQALAQCRETLASRWPDVKTVAVLSNGQAAQLAMKEKGTAAIGGDMFDGIYKLNRIAENIEDVRNNCTRFVIIRKTDNEPSGDDKSFICVTTKNIPGALFSILEPFKEENVMLTRVVTRPRREEPWSYMFFIEFFGHINDEKIKYILKELKKRTITLKYLGSFPKNPLI